MNHHTLTAKQIAAYTKFLRTEERTAATVEKYFRDTRAFAEWLGERQVTKETVVQWKEKLLKDCFSPVTVNAKLSAVNGLLRFLGWEECGIKFVKVQKRVFRDASRGLICDEYQRLLDAARTLGRERLKYAEKQKNAFGEIFLSENGTSLSRVQIWRKMKRICKTASVEPSKVFPHNLRHLFATTFIASYDLQTSAR